MYYINVLYKCIRSPYLSNFNIKKYGGLGAAVAASGTFTSVAADELESEWEIEDSLDLCDYETYL